MHENRDPAIRLFGHKIPLPEEDLHKEEAGHDSGEHEIQEDKNEGDKVRFVFKKWF